VSALLSTQMIRDLRRVAASAMHDLIVLRTPGAPTDDGAGNVIPGAATIATVYGWLRPRGGNIATIAERVQAQGSYALWLAHDQPIVLTTTVTYAGLSYRIVYLPPVTWDASYREAGLELDG